MNEPVTRQRPTIDFDEFERSVREPAGAARPQDGDPLAELARLVGTRPDPYGDVFAEDRRQAPSGRPGEQAPRRPTVDFSAIEAGLRGTLPGEAVAPVQVSYPQASYPQAGYPQAGYPHPGYPQTYAQQGYPDPANGHQGYAPDAYAAHDHAVADQAWQEPAAASPAARDMRSRRPIYAMVAVIVAGIVGIGVAFAYKGSNSGPREIAMIKAVPGPTKIQPPADDSADQPTRDASILDKAQQPAPTKLVSRQEQPVDLSQTVNNAPRDVGAGLMPLYNFGSPGGGDAASVPVPPPPGAQDSQKPAEALGIAGDIEPIRVRTRSYRPDGTPIPNDQPPAAAMDNAPPAAPKVDKAALAKTATPKTTTPKSTTRIATTPKPIVTASRGDDAAPAATDPATPAAHKAKAAKAAPKAPTKIADATDNADDAAATQNGAAPNAAARNDAAPADAAPAGGGGFAVQLAAPGSEAEAKQASSRLSQKFASELSGHRLGFHKASSNGKSVFRVRVGSLTREEATDMCEKLKSSGGTCFVAKN